MANRVDDVQRREDELVGVAGEEVLHALVHGLGVSADAPDALDRVHDEDDLLAGVPRLFADQGDDASRELPGLLRELGHMPAEALLDAPSEVGIVLER